MLCPDIGVEVPASLVVDFASDPESGYEKALAKLNDPGWPLHEQLMQLLESLPLRRSQRLGRQDLREYLWN
jgi:hypothetical protein